MLASQLPGEFSLQSARTATEHVILPISKKRRWGAQEGYRAHCRGFAKTWLSTDHGRTQSTGMGDQREESAPHDACNVKGFR